MSSPVVPPPVPAALPDPGEPIAEKPAPPPPPPLSDSKPGLSPLAPPVLHAPAICGPPPAQPPGPPVPATALFASPPRASIAPIVIDEYDRILTGELWPALNVSGEALAIVTCE